MLPRLEAQRQLDTINAMSIAFGGGTRGDRRRYIAGLERRANGVTRTAPATPAALAAMGIGVVVVPADEGQADG